MRKKNSKINCDRDDIYIVENILNKKIEDGKTFYKIKWEGYSVKKSTWEPSENLSKSLIEIYEKSVSKGISYSNYISNKNNVKNTFNGYKIKKILKTRKWRNEFYYQVVFDDGSINYVPLKDIEGNSLVKEYERKNSNEYNSRKNKKIFSETKTNEKITSSKKNMNKSSLSDTSLQDIAVNGENVTKKRSSQRLQEAAKFGNNKLNQTAQGTPKVISKIKKRSKQNYNAKMEEEFFVVEKIIDHRILDGVKEYKVRWSGYPPDEDTWQTVDTFNDKNIIDLYEKEIEQQSKEKIVSNEIKEKKNEASFIEKLFSDIKKDAIYSAEEIIGLIDSYLDKNEKLSKIIPICNGANQCVKFKTQ